MNDMQQQTILCNDLHYIDSLVEQKLLDLAKQHIFLYFYNQDCTSYDSECFYFYQDITLEHIIMLQVIYIKSGALIFKQNSFSKKLFDIFNQVKPINTNVVHVLQRKEQ